MANKTFFVDQEVSTPYGPGRVIGLCGPMGKDQVIVEPSTWTLAAGQRPKFYMNPSDVTPKLLIGDEITSGYGKGKIDEIREDGIYIVSLVDWVLANKKSPKAYLSASSISKFQPKSQQETFNASFAAANARAMQSKEQGSLHYKAQEFMQAKLKYGEAMGIMQSQDGDLNNEQRSYIFEMSVMCSSNMALCCWSLNEFAECIIHGRNTILLIQAIESKLKDSAIWVELQKRGMTLQKLKLLKAKNARIVGKAEFEKGDFNESKKDLELALTVSEDAKTIKELNDLLSKCNKKISVQLKKEKSMWKKAFEVNNTVPDEVVSPVASPVKPNQSQSVEKSVKEDAEKRNEKKDEPDEDNGSKGTVSKFYDYAFPFLFTFTTLATVGYLGYSFWLRRRR